MQLKKELENTVSKIIKAFEKKQEVYFEFFVSDDYTGIACFSNEYYINLTDICHDVFTEQPKGLIIEWQENTIDNHEKQYINYLSYCKGARYK